MIMRRKSLLLSNGCAIGNQFKAQVIERRAGHPDFGKVVFETPWASNLILENGMNHLSTFIITYLFGACAIGTGTTPTENSSGAITATCSGVTVTSSTTFFQSSDVGALFRFSTGEKARIATYIDPNNVTTEGALGVSSPTLFTLYRIQQTGLGTELKRSSTFLTGAGNCGSTYSGGTYTHTRTYDFTAESSPTYYYEVGFSHTSTPGANLNMRGIFSGAPVAVLAGQQLRVVYNVLVTVSPVSPRARSVTISGWPSLRHPVTVDPSSGRVAWVGHALLATTKIFLTGTSPPGGMAFSTTYYVLSDDADHFYLAATSGGSVITTTSSGVGIILFTNTDGHEQMVMGDGGWSRVDENTGGTVSQDGNPYTNEPACFGTNAGTYTTLSVETSAFPAYNTFVALTGLITGGIQATVADSYVSGSYTQTCRTTFAVGQGNNSLIRKVGFGLSNGACGLVYFFDYAQEKTSLFTLTIVWRATWDRNFL
jgi:hypothetical protein